MKIQTHFMISLSLIYVAVQKISAISWEVKPCPADEFKLKSFTSNEISVKSSSSSISICQWRRIVFKIRVTSKNDDAVKLGRSRSSGYSGDVIFSDDSKIEKEFKFGQMKFFACVEYKIQLEFVARSCNSVRKFKCSGKEKGVDKFLDSAVITAFLNEVEPIENMVLNYGNYGNNTRFYLYISPTVQLCEAVYIFTVYSTINESSSEKVYETVIPKSDIVDVPNLTESMKYQAHISLKANNTHGVTIINQTIPFILNKSSANDADWNVKNLHVESSGPAWVSLAWQPPDLQLSVVSYFLEVYSENGTLLRSEQLAKNTTAFNVTDSLTPRSTYRIDLTTIEKKLIALRSINATTGDYHEVAPGKVQNLQVEIDDLEFIASWEPPNYGEEYVANVIYNKALNATTYGGLIPDSTVSIIMLPKTTHRLHNLAACIEYSVTVQAMTHGRKEGLNASISRTTPPHVFLPPDNGEVVQIWSTAALLSWRVAYTNSNQCTMDKLIVHCYNKAGKAFEFTSTDRNSNGTVFVYCLPLEPFAEYSCTSVAVNSAGESNSSLPIVFMTLQDVPSPPMSVKVEEKISDSILVSWEQPEIIPGILTNYTVVISCQGPAYSVPDDCKVKTSGSVQNQTVPSTETLALLDNLQPYYKYGVSVMAATEAGYGDSSPEINIITMPNVSEVVRNVTINVHYNESLVTWRPPCTSNGVIANFSLTLTGNRNGFISAPSRHWFISRDQNWDYLGDLLPETTYELSISVLVENVSEENPFTTLFTSSARIPEVPAKITQELVEVDPKLSSKPSSEAEVMIKKSFFNHANGEIRYLALLVAEDHMITEARSGVIANKTWPYMTTWAVACNSQHIIMYQATPKWWSPLEGSETEVVRYTLGRETCSEMDIHTYCNGPLTANTIYAMRIRVFTSAGYRDSPPIRFKTDVGFPYNLIMSLFLGFFVVTSLVIIVAYILSSKRRRKASKTEHKYLEELPAKKLLAHCNVVLEHKNLMHSEFLHLAAISDTLDISSDVAKLSINMPKNRYTNILPYDFNRVILDGGEGCDYINASYITDETLRNEIEYVACQAPKDNTVLDFWRMIVQCGIRAIVMLCNLREKNKEKCHWYFPEEFETLEFGDISVHCSKKIANESFIQRFIIIKMPNQGEIKIDHYHFVDWPDFEAPSDAIPMIKLCQVVRADVGLATIAVHCSAGVGRTGTYIAVDMLLRHLNHRRKVSAFRTVLKLRGQRASMVQNEEQYAYIYKVLKHTLDNPTLFFRKGSRLLPSSGSNSSSLDGQSLLSLSLKVRS